MSGGGEASMQAAVRYFGLHPLTLMDDVFNMLQDYVSQSGDSLDASIASHPLVVKALSPPSDTEEEAGQADDETMLQVKTRIREAVSAYLLALVELRDRNFDKFELYCLRNVFRLPESASVEVTTTSTTTTATSAGSASVASSSQGDEPLTVPPTEEEEEALDAEITALRKEVRQLAYAKRQMQLDLKSLLSSVATLEEVSQALSVLTSDAYKKDVDSVTALMTRLHGARSETATALQSAIQADTLFRSANHLPPPAPYAAPTLAASLR